MLAEFQGVGRGSRGDFLSLSRLRPGGRAAGQPDSRAAVAMLCPRPYRLRPRMAANLRCPSSVRRGCLPLLPRGCGRSVRPCRIRLPAKIRQNRIKGAFAPLFWRISRIGVLPRVALLPLRFDAPSAAECHAGAPCRSLRPWRGGSRMAAACTSVCGLAAERLQGLRREGGRGVTPWPEHSPCGRIVSGGRIFREEIGVLFCIFATK